MSWAITKKAINSDFSTPLDKKLGRVQQDGGFDGAVLVNVEIIDEMATLLAGQISGTVTQTITPDSLYKFENIFFNTVTPANTSISCRILDADDNELIASITDKGSLASIDTTQYKSIKAEWTLTRVATTDASPELHSIFGTWTGQARVINARIPQVAHATTGSFTANVYYTALDVLGSGKLNRISYFTSNNVAGNQVRITIDGVQTVFNKGNEVQGFYRNTTAQGSNTLDYFCDIEFSESLKVEYRTNVTGSGTPGIACAVNYALI